LNALFHEATWGTPAKVADQPSRARVVFFAQQADIVSQTSSDRTARAHLASGAAGHRLNHRSCHARNAPSPGGKPSSAAAVFVTHD